MRVLALLWLLCGGCDFGYSIGVLPDGGAVGGDAGVHDGGVCGSAQATVHIHDMAFDPAALEVPSGTRVTWINDDTVSHDVTQGSPGGASAFSSGPLAPGASYFRDFCEPGTTVYFCAAHPNTMRDATVVVRP